MNILLISISAPPKNSPESFQTARYLKYMSQDHEVTLLTTRITGGWEPEDKSLMKYLQKARQVVSLYALPPRVISLMKRFFPALLMPDEGVAFTWQAGKAAKAIKDKPSVVFSRSLPYSSAIMGMELARHWNVPWIMHLSDPWVDNPFFTLKGKLRQRHQRLELECFEAARIITLTSDKTLAFYKKKYPHLAEKFKFLPNVFDKDDCNVGPPSQQTKMRFVFTGRLYGTRSIHRFLDTMEEALGRYPELEANTEVLLAGFFDEENITRIRQSPLKNVTYLGALSLDEALQLQQQAHVLVLIDSIEQDERYNLFFPSKLLDYLAANRMILALTNRESTTYEVVEGKAGKCFYPENMNEMPAFIRKMIDEFQTGTFQHTTNAADLLKYEASFNAKRLEQMFFEILKDHE